MRPTKAAKVLYLVNGLRAGKVLNCMKYRCCMWLDCDAVFGPQAMKIKRGHDGDHRRARRLMPANLDIRITGCAQVVGVVDHPTRKPQQPSFNGFQGM